MYRATYHSTEYLVGAAHTVTPGRLVYATPDWINDPRSPI